VPGPLFTFAAYLGAVTNIEPHGMLGSLVSLIAIFLPGLLLVYGTLPFGNAVRKRPLAQAAICGTNALLSAFSRPPFMTRCGLARSSIHEISLPA
jgi:chromate transporter